MSSEGKKKRGEAGRANALSKPFRLGGRPCDYSTAPRNSNHPRGGGTLMVRAFELAAMLVREGKTAPVMVSPVLAGKVEAAMEHCDAEKGRSRSLASRSPEHRIAA